MYYTRKGDSGTSGLFGTTERFPKDSAIYDALGTVDELNSLLGLCRASATHDGRGVDISLRVHNVQEHLCIILAELAGASQTIMQADIDDMERVIMELSTLIENPHAFVIPGSTEASALFDFARAVARRAERTLIAADASGTISMCTYAYMNRLSTLLYMCARYTAPTAQTKEPTPSYIH